MSDLIERGRVLAPVDRARVAGDWRERRYSCKLFADPPGRQWNDFAHFTDERVTVAGDMLELTRGGQRHQAAPGDQFLTPSNTGDPLKSVNSGTKRWLCGVQEMPPKIGASRT